MDKSSKSDYKFATYISPFGYMSFQKLHKTNSALTTPKHWISKIPSQLCLITKDSKTAAPLLLHPLKPFIYLLPPKPQKHEKFKCSNYHTSRQVQSCGFLTFKNTHHTFKNIFSHCNLINICLYIYMHVYTYKYTFKPKFYWILKLIWYIMTHYMDFETGPDPVCKALV